MSDDVKSTNFLPSKIPKGGKKQKRLAEVSHTVVSTHRPIHDYQRCLDVVGIKVRWNEYAGLQVNLGDEAGWQCATIEALVAAYGIVNRNCQLAMETTIEPANFSNQDRDNAIKELVYKNRYNPLKQYFNGLEAKPYPGAIKLLTKAFNINPRLHEYAGDVVILGGKGLYMRTLNPGTSFPHFPIFAGPQGIGKSYFLELWLPPWVAKEVYKPNFDMSLDHKERALVVSQAALIEASELAGHGRRDIATNKAFISSNYFHVRRPFSPYPETLQRRDILWGSTNENACLPIDPSGDRRNIIIPVAHKELNGSPVVVEKYLPDLMHQERDAFWADIKYRVEKEGEFCSYEFWTAESRKIRKELIGLHEKRTYLLEGYIDDLLMSDDEFVEKFGLAKTLHWDGRLKDWEIREGIPFDLPPESPKRSIMKLLPREVTSRYTTDFIAKTLTKKGWTTIHRKRERTDDGVSFVSVKQPPNPQDSSVPSRRAFTDCFDEDSSLSDS